MFNRIMNKKGVTLVELLAVVVIMGIVAAIAVPTIGGLIANQQANADRATFSQLEEAARLYAVSDDDGDFTLSDMSSYIDLRSNVLRYSLTATADDITNTAIQALTKVTPATLLITVDGSKVKFGVDGTTDDFDIDLFINYTKVVDLGD